MQYLLGRVATMTNENSTRYTYSFPNLDSDVRISELVLYIAEKCLDDPRFGAVKLNKILYFADVMSYRLYGEPITGGQYMKLSKGPVLKRMKLILQSLVDRNRAVIVKRKVHDFEENRIVATSEPNLDIFRARDIALLDEIIRMNWGKTANEVSEASHGIAWEVAQDQQLIPYEAMLLSDQNVTEDDIARAQELIRQHGWNV